MEKKEAGTGCYNFFLQLQQNSTVFVVEWWEDDKLYALGVAKTEGAKVFIKNDESTS